MSKPLNLIPIDTTSDRLGEEALQLLNIKEQKGNSAKNEDYETEEQRKLRLINDKLENENKQRQEYASQFLRIAKYWLGFVAAIVFLNGIFHACTSRVAVANSVLITLISTSLGVVIAPASLIGGSLFKGKE